MTDTSGVAPSPFMASAVTFDDVSDSADMPLLDAPRSVRLHSLLTHGGTCVALHCP